MARKYSEKYLKRIAADIKKHGIQDIKADKITSSLPVTNITSSINPNAGVKSAITGEYIIKPRGGERNAKRKNHR